MTLCHKERWMMIVLPSMKSGIQLLQTPMIPASLEFSSSIVSMTITRHLALEKSKQVTPAGNSLYATLRPATSAQ